MIRTRAPTPTPMPAMLTGDRPLLAVEEFVGVDTDATCDVAWEVAVSIAELQNQVLDQRERQLTVASTEFEVVSATRVRIAMLCAPIPSPELATTAVLYVLPSEIAVNRSMPTLPLNIVVQPRCNEPVAASALHKYKTRPLQHTKSVKSLPNHVTNLASPLPARKSLLHRTTRKRRLGLCSRHHF